MPSFFSCHRDVSKSPNCETKISIFCTKLQHPQLFYKEGEPHQFHQLRRPLTQALKTKALLRVQMWLTFLGVGVQEWLAEFLLSRYQLRAISKLRGEGQAKIFCFFIFDGSPYITLLHFLTSFSGKGFFWSDLNLSITWQKVETNLDISK